MRSWVIGSSTDCDVIVDSPIASARHCQLTQMAEGLVLNDLGSTNGTYVNGLRIAVPTLLATGDSITLGRTVAFPWPPELTSSTSIGRLPDNDIVLDDPRVSGHHARLIGVTGFQTAIEDIGSSNGTFLNSADRRVTSPTPITESDTLYFGTLAVPAARLLAQAKQTETAKSPPPAVTAVSEMIPKPAPVRSAVGVPEEIRWLLVWLAQVPVLAVLIVLIFGRPAPAANRESVGQAIAATTFALALAAIWSGCSLAVAEVATGRLAVHQPSADPAKFLMSIGSRLVILISLCTVACALLLAIVYWGSGLKGPWLAMSGVLVMAALIGLFFGLMISALVPNWSTAGAVLLMCFVPIVALGGGILPLPRMNPPIRLATAAMPSRWAFEGLLLLETAQHETPAATPGSGPDQTHDLVEGFFPAESERMGVKADAMALGSILIGLAALTVFISGLSRLDRWTLSNA